MIDASGNFLYDKECKVTFSLTSLPQEYGTVRCLSSLNQSSKTTLEGAKPINLSVWIASLYWMRF